MVGFANADLDQFVRFEACFDLKQDTWRQSPGADDDNGFEGMGAGPQGSSFSGVELFHRYILSGEGDENRTIGCFITTFGPDRSFSGNHVKKGSSKIGNSWMREHVNDHYVQQAKARGFRSRAAFKLIQIDEKDRLIAPGMCVVDLGAAPGSWAQVLAQKVGASGRVIALDLLPIEPITGVELIQGDFREDEPLSRLTSALSGRKLDLVVSDMAPNITGIASGDQARSMDLCELALEFACQHLRADGDFLVKVFQGGGYPEYLARVRRAFRTVASRKPDASRGRSAEMYLLGKGYLGN